MYLFILESIGTSELILIALVALMFFGPRKLPDFARQIGKIMNEFRRSSNEFKQTWEREVDSEVNKFKEESSLNSISKNGDSAETAVVKEKEIVAPEIKELSREDFNIKIPAENSLQAEKAEREESLTGKQNWL